MKIKTSELTGTALDWAVAKCGGGGNFPASFKQAHENGMSNYSTNWAQGGLIIEREGIDICTSTRGGWIATLLIDCENDEVVRGEGETCLIAAMRCYVASELGFKVDVPDELI
jgi:hypothetical protein